MPSKKLYLIAALPLALAACGDTQYDPRGVDHAETLLSVSATGQADARPDEAFFQAGVESWARNAGAASKANTDDMAEVVQALIALGIEGDDIQSRTVSVRKIDWGAKKGQFQASNIVAVTVRDVDQAGAAVTAATEAGANIVGGPDLRMSDPEAAANTAYGAAFKAAQARAQAYADAADMQISRVLTIRDAGGSQGNRYFAGAVPPPVAVMARNESMAEETSDTSGRIMPGQTTSNVAVQVDFALMPK